MLNLLAAISCSLSIGVLFKLAGRAEIDRLGLLTVNYLAALLIALLPGAGRLTTVLEPGAWTFVVASLGTGILFIFGFYLYAAATARSGLALATCAMRISVVVPFLASLLVWRESPGRYQMVGLGLALISLVLVTLSGPRSSREVDGNESRKGGLTLLILFVVAGATDTVLKLFEESFAALYDRPTFLVLVFGAAFAGGCAAMVWRLDWSSMLDARTVGAGALLGALNYGSVEFFLRALRTLPGTVAFPVNHVAIVLGGTLLGVAIWKEPLSRRNWVGLALASLSLFLLTS